MRKIARKTVYNDIVSDELYEKVNQDNKYLLEEFVEYLQSTGKSELTVINYISDIKIYYVWNLQNNKNRAFTDITKRNVMRYQNWLITDLKLSSSRIRRLRASISSMSNFIENVLDEDYPDFRNIINKIPAPSHQTAREKTVFEDEELEDILNKLVEDEFYQEACCLALAISSGARKSELKRFKVDYFVDKYIIHGSLYKTPVKIKTKGTMLHKYTLSNIFDPYFELWMEKRKELGIDNEYLFVTKRKGKWLQARVSTLDSWAEKINRYTDKHFYFHSCRHYYTTHLHKSNIPAEIIREIVGWKNVDMVTTYTDVEIDDELEKYFDKDGIKKIDSKDLKDLT